MKDIDLIKLRELSTEILPVSMQKDGLNYNVVKTPSGEVFVVPSNIITKFKNVPNSKKT